MKYKIQLMGLHNRTGRVEYFTSKGKDLEDIRAAVADIIGAISTAFLQGKNGYIYIRDTLIKVQDFSYLTVWIEDEKGKRIEDD